MLAPAMFESRIIPNGIDQGIFKPADKTLIRQELGLDPSAKIVLIQTTRNYHSNRFKDFETTRQCVSSLLENRQDNIIVLAVGLTEEENPFRSGKVKLFPYISSPESFAKFYQVADIFLHSAFSDNFPSVILESLSCGTPVIATNVGGIPEQVREGENGFLVRRENAADMTEKAMTVLNDSALLERLGNSALKFSRPKFSLERMVDQYESWYSMILEARGRGNQTKQN